MGEDRKEARMASKTSIAWHPLFPAIVAVWFGALFGLGALAVRVSLLERLAVASEIDLIIPAAGPPLGMTARIVIALGLALAGGIIGALVGHLMARSKPAAVIRRAEAAAAKAPPAAATNSDPAPTDSRDGPSFFDISDLGLDVETARASALPHPATAVESAPIEDAAEQSPRFPSVLTPNSIDYRLPPGFPLPGEAAAQRLVSADLDSLSHLELIERLALSLQRQREGRAKNLAGPQPALGAASTPPQSEGSSHYLQAPRSAAGKDIPPASSMPNDPRGTMLETSVEGGRPLDQRPVALFRDQSSISAKPSKSERTEQALRQALATLQKMSGAA